MELLLGCGSRTTKDLALGGDPTFSSDLIRLDIDPVHEPDIVWDLNDTPWPFDDNSFTEVHAYEVLEHLGSQGDYRAFFAHFYEAWRILEPGGYLCGSSPAITSPWLWGDPGHTRAITPESFVFLDQDEYAQVGQTAMTDYRSVWHGDFERAYLHVQGDQFFYALRARK